jgi:hypothetical protein
MVRNPIRTRPILVASLMVGGLLVSAPRHAWAQG